VKPGHVPCPRVDTRREIFIFTITADTSMEFGRTKGSLICVMRVTSVTIRVVASHGKESTERVKSF